MPEITAVTDDSFASDVLKADLPVLVDFSATWCGPCRAMAPVVEDLERAYRGKAIVRLMDIEHNPVTGDAYGITSVPTFVLFRGGEAVERIAGPTSRSHLAAMLDSAIAA